MALAIFGFSAVRYSFIITVYYGPILCYALHVNVRLKLITNLYRLFCVETFQTVHQPDP